MSQWSPAYLNRHYLRTPFLSKVKDKVQELFEFKAGVRVLRALTAFGRQFVLPNGIILLIAFGVQRLAVILLSEQNSEMAVFVIGAAALALAWRFHLPRMALALATVVVIMF